MKKVVFIYIIILLLIISPSYGHSGGTDSNGGHHVTATGSYHYHHGYPAHDHINGICPYSNNENKKSSTSSSANSLIPIILSGGFGIFAISSYKNQKKQKDIKRQKDLKEKQFQEEKAHYSNLYLGKNPEEVANIPKNIRFDSNMLPIISDHSEHKWGRLYTVYITKNGKSYHHTKDCSNSSIPMHIFSASKLKVPCKRCVKNHVETPVWYAEYLKICRIKEKYNIQ